MTCPSSQGAETDPGLLARTTSDDSPLVRTQTALKAVSPKNNSHASGQDDLSTEEETGVSKDGFDWDDDDEDDNSDLVRTLRHDASSEMQHMSRSVAPRVFPSDANLEVHTADAARGFQVKNTFVHVDDGNDLLRRTESSESDDPLGRTKSDPTGQKYPMPGRQKRIPGVGAVPEEPAFIELESLVEDAEKDGLLERATTYDPFTAQALPLGDKAAHESAENGQGVDDHTLERLTTYDPFATALAPSSDNWTAPGSAPAALPGFQMPAAPMGLFTPIMLPFQYPQYPYPFAPAPAAAGETPPFGTLHSFHKETKGFGTVSSDFRMFTKGQDYEGRLSVLSGSEVQKGGVQRYLMQFTAGELSKADGVGFVFASRLPCAKNIQKIVSVFVNQQGQICMRVFGEVIKAKAHVRPLRVGDWIEMAIDLEKASATFNVWAPNPDACGYPLPGKPESTAEFRYGRRLAQANQNVAKPVKLNAGHFACVIQNVGVTVTMGS